MTIKPDKYLRLLGVPSLFGSGRTKKILSVNPTIPPVREEAVDVRVFIHDYKDEELKEYELKTLQIVLV